MNVNQSISFYPSSFSCSVPVGPCTVSRTSGAWWRPSSFWSPQAWCSSPGWYHHNSHILLSFHPTNAHPGLLPLLLRHDHRLLPLHHRQPRLHLVQLGLLNGVPGKAISDSRPMVQLYSSYLFSSSCIFSWSSNISSSYLFRRFLTWDSSWRFLCLESFSEAQWSLQSPYINR